MSKFKMKNDDFENEFIDSNYDNYHSELEKEFWDQERDEIAKKNIETNPYLLAHIKQELERLEKATGFGSLDTPEKRAKFIKEAINEEMQNILFFNFDIDISDE